MPKNINKIPPIIIERIRTFGQDDVVVASVKLLRVEDIPRYSGLGLTLVEGKLVTPSPAVPNPNAGRYSLANVEGKEKIRKDLPMVFKTFEVELPNWGHSSSGTHPVSWTREVYQREFYPPKEVELSVTLLEEQNGAYVVKFAIDQVINRRTKNFEQELFYNLNLLQENIGAADVFQSAASLAEYAATVRVDWQILPPGTVDEVVRKMLVGKRGVTPKQEEVMKERITVLSQLKPEQFIAGSDGFLRYFGAKFADDFVVFENLRYGNALYLMYESWQELSKRSRVELLSGPRESFHRILHNDGWKLQLKGYVQAFKDQQKENKR